MSVQRLAWRFVLGSITALAAAYGNAIARDPGAVRTSWSVIPLHAAGRQVSGACDRAALLALVLEHARVTDAIDVPQGGFTLPRASAPLRDLPSFCRISAEATPSSDSRITFEVWVPREWNGKVVTTGNGGYGNTLSYRDMAYALAQGYAAVGGDTGHQSAADDLLWGHGHPERIIDWGSRSIHAITVPAKRIVAHVTGRPSARAYFYGCSTGGHQAYAEMQRYPDDFDGVVAGAPGNNRVRLNVGFLWQFLSNRRRGTSELIVPPAKLPILTRAAVAACDANDGVLDDVVDDPRTCQFDPASLLCREGDAPNCLTREQVDAVRRMYDGAKNPRTGETLYPGWPPSSEALTASPAGLPTSGWQQYWGGAEPTRANFWRAWLFDNPAWDPWSFDFDAHVALADRTLAPLVDQNSVDLSAFKSRGGKAIVYQGWQDPVVNPKDTVAYYERLRERQGSQAATDDFFRLFLVAGMGHCGGGPGATTFGNSGERAPTLDADHDLLMALDAWVERGRAPDRLVASKVERGVAVRTRPLCAYPRRSTYQGAGSTDRAENFVCR